MGHQGLGTPSIARKHIDHLSAGVIHGDFERGFIKAEVVAYQDFHDLCEGGKSLGPIKAAGKFRQEGKTYVSISNEIKMLSAEIQ